MTFELPPLVGTATVTRAWWADASTTPCSGGIATSGAALDVLFPPVPFPVEVDDFRVWRLRFERRADDGGLPSERSVVDLQMNTEGRRACLRVPFTRRGGEADWRPYTDWFVGLGMRAHYFVPEPRTDTGADLGTVTLAVGRWTSRTTRVFVEPGYSANGSPGPQFSLGIHHEKVFVRRGKFAAGVSAGYVAMAIPRRFATSEPWFLHGPEFSLRLKETLPESIGGGFPGLLQDAAAELILPVNVWVGHGAKTRALGFTVGWGIAFH